MGNNNQLFFSHIGSPTLHHLKLPTVLVVPKITKRLLSVSKLSKENNVYLQFWHNHCSVKSLNGHTLLTRDIKDGLYRVPASLTTLSNNSTLIIALTGVRTSLHGWHKRLAHPHAPLLKHMLSSFKLPTSSNAFLVVCLERATGLHSLVLMLHL